ncbi:hypothetical protein [Herbiconiux sp. L3-i23]|uniref:hypothetical protein n=1 Tax=Herbiconiux sp. L3-i23 TaxID=2905871 RepID=UPI00206AE14B|nr:hypothetical protein [Herbiconiux sp. L3-i23]BDI23383.1 hypothetical protein L3i23_21590 [Herbiconiux sp. L3-i23]
MSDEFERSDSAVPPALAKSFDRLMAVQRPAVLANIRTLRRLRPDATPQQLLKTLERQYLAAVTTSGAAVGASAVIPGVGVGMSLALSGVETAGFLEASALFAQSVAEVHGISVTEPDRARVLVMALMMGEGGQSLVKQFAGQLGGRSPGRSVFWGELVTSNLPQAVVGPLTDSLKRHFIKSFITRHGTSVIGRVVPFGIGAAIGGTGNHLLGRRVVRSARDAFPPAPLEFRAELAPQQGGERKRFSLKRRSASQPFEIGAARETSDRADADDDAHDPAN